MEILSGLNNLALQRLKHLWKGVSKKSKQDFAHLESVMNAGCNFKQYRRTVFLRKGPLLPYFAVYLKDVTYLTTAYEPYVNDCPNEDFLKKWGFLVSEMMKFQSEPYNLEIQSEARSYLIDSRLYYLTDESLYQHSLRHQKSKTEEGLEEHSLPLLTMSTPRRKLSSIVKSFTS